MKIVATLLPCLSVTFWFRFERFTWTAGLKASSFGMVSSPSRATDQKAVVRQAKTAASKGSLGFRFSRMATRSSIVQGGL